MLHLHFANRIERLRERLIDAVRASAPRVFEPVQVVVPSLAMRRHLMLALAAADGVCANVRFEFLAQWLYAQPRRSGADVPATSALAPATLVWRVFAAFDDAGFVAPHPRLAAWLATADAAMRLELAERAARLIEQYATYRAEWLPRWAAGRRAESGRPLAADEAWQAAIWRRLQAERPLADPRQVLQALLAAHPGGLFAPPGLPAAVHVFALPTMPPLHFELLQGWAQRTEVHVYALNPSAEFWFDGAMGRRRGAATSAALGADSHPLLVAWGQQQRQQLERLVAAIGDDGTLDDEAYEPLGGTTLLGRLHDSLLEAANPAPGQWAIDEADRSIELHACHSLVRQVEVLHDRLLGLFAADPTLRADDVLVVVPDLEAAAPLIDAVFGSAPAARALPYTITGRPGSQVNTVARALIALLTLAPSRWLASEVFALLQQPPVARRFDLDSEALELLRTALDEAGVRWGADADHRAALGLPATRINSFADGLERLLLGHLLPDGVSTEPFAGVLPAAGIEGSAAAGLGGLAAFLQALAGLRQALAEPLAAADWRARLDQILETFFDVAGDERDEQRALRSAIDDTCTAIALAVAEVATGTAGELRIPLAALQAALVTRLDDPAHGGVPGGAITVSSMNSLRGLPYAWVCVLGLDDGVFPARAQPDEFDLIALAPRAGDRQRRHDDRALFLDLVLAARCGLHLSYSGRSARDNAVLPPSVVVAELLDFLLAASGGERTRFVVEHPLQPFSPAAFSASSDPRIRSHHAELAAALGPVANPSSALTTANAPTDDDPFDEEHPAAAARFEPLPPPFFDAPLPAPDEAERTVDLKALQRFFDHPARALLRGRLGLAWSQEIGELEDTEPLLPGRREQQALADRLLPVLIAAPEADAAALARAGNDWPAGDFGAPALASLLADLRDFAAALPGGAPLPPASLSLIERVDGQAWTLQATLAETRPSGLSNGRWDTLDGRALLTAWIDHLALCLAVERGLLPAQPRTTLLRRDGRWSLCTVADPALHLGALMRLYAAGQHEPLVLPRRSTWAYVQALRAEKTASQCLSAAREAWRGNVHARVPAESDDTVWRIALRGRPEPIDGAFAATVEALFVPLLAHLEDGPLP